MEPSANQARAGKLRQLVSNVQRHVKTRSRSMLSPSETSTELKQSDLQRCIATVNSYSNHLGELRGLWEQHNHLLSSQPESKQRIDLIIQKSRADIEHCEKILRRCSLAELDDDGETRMWRKLRWELIDRHKFEHHKAQAERNDNTITTHIFALHHLILDRAVSKLLNGARTPATANGLIADNEGNGVNGQHPVNTGLTVPRLIVTRPGLPASPRPVRGSSTPPPPRPPGSGKGKQAAEQRQRPSSEPMRQPPTMTATGKTCCHHGECHGKRNAKLAIEEEQTTASQQPEALMVGSTTTTSTTDFAAEPTSAPQTQGHGEGLTCYSKGANMSTDVESRGIKLVH
ncbi:hypothetical protein QBC36DRAFT_366048 [Triangularia setosa]|uniref:Uncharacterized protein n=1 Tax=Triangularia setosa TaxID=2587417 RepID=A0AAN6WEY7_9PEZI|nr:hypothetical protein QBC36DRAFT_366048 [Podospora setosa]